MELQIPQTFKVQWLNTTLKFIKDDTQLVKDYPQMPYSHVEYLHNLIWQRKNDVGLGFKSLYSPVWEAMKIYSVKYRFKIIVEKSEDGMSGHLIMEKIPKISQPAKKINDEEKDKNNNDENKERDNEAIRNPEDTKKSQTEAAKCKRRKTRSKKKAKTKSPVSQMSKDQKMYMENQDILDSLSPLFIKMILKLILDFLSDKLSASKIFSNLAPIESRFLENFLSIQQRKNDLEVLLSPACNELLTEISKCFDNFSETYCLDISCVGVNSNTNRREVKYTKIPFFPQKEMVEPKLEENSMQTNFTTVSSNKDTTKLLNMPSISKEEFNMRVKENESNDSKTSKLNNQTKSLQINVIGEDRYVNSKPIDKVIDTIDKNVIEALSPSVKKPCDVNPKTTTHLKDTSLNKSGLLPKKSTSLITEGNSNAAYIPSNEVDQKSLKKEIKQDGTVALNGDKIASQNSAVPKKTQTEAVKCKQPKPQSLKKEKIIKPIPQMSKGLKFFMENQNILDSLSPWFIKTMLKLILDFLTDELSASKIFSNLASTESRFLENFLSIQQRKNDLEVLLSPACNELLSEISKCFDNFSETYCLDISCVGVNSNTNRRQIKYTKVPVFPSKKKAKQKLKEKKIQAKYTTIPSNEDTTKLLNMPSFSKEEYNMRVEKNVLNESKKSKSKTKSLQNNAIVEHRYVISEPFKKVIETIDNNVIKALSTHVNKTDDVKPKTITYMKETTVNKSVPLPKKSIGFTREGTSNTVDTPYVKVEQRKPQMKILQDMTVPLNSDKAARMMQLMGWKGGALGLRGDGITEPIIPTPNFKNCGLGHVTVKKESKKETKNQIRNDFINKILYMIDNDVKVSVIKLQNKLNKRESKFFKLTIQIINDRMNLDLDFEKRLEVKDKMLKNMDIIFNIDIEDENRKIILTKTSKPKMKVIQNTSQDTNAEEIDTNAIQNTDNEETFKAVILKSILELINSEDKKKMIHFNNELKARHGQCSNTIILLINDRQHVQHKNSRVVAELGSKVLEAIGDLILSVKINESERYIVIRKKHPTSYKKNIKTVVNKAKSVENNENAFDTVRNYLQIKKKHKLLNALYRYEMEDTEEFEENQWYRTVDKSFLDREKITIQKLTRIIKFK